MEIMVTCRNKLAQHSPAELYTAPRQNVVFSKVANKPFLSEDILRSHRIVGDWDISVSPHQILGRT